MNVKRTPSRVIHQIAGCYECNIRWENYKNAGRKARYHTQKTGHETYVETGSTYIYTKA